MRHPQGRLGLHGALLAGDAGNPHQRCQVVADAVAVDGRDDGELRGRQVLHPRRMGRVRQVGPPLPFTPTWPAGKACTSAPAASSRAARDRVAVRDNGHAGADGEDVAAEREVLLLGHLHQPHVPLLQQLQQPAREERQEHHRQVVGDRRDHAHQVHQLAGALPVGDVEYLNLYLRFKDGAELSGAGAVGAKRAAHAQCPLVQPERVAALRRAGRLDPPQRRDAVLVAPAFDHQLLADPVGLAGQQRQHAAVGDQRRVEGVGEVGVVIGVQLVDGRAQVGQDRRQRVVLALGRVQVDRVQVAVGGIVEGGAEGRGGAVSPGRRAAARSCSGRRRCGCSCLRTVDCRDVP